MFLQESQNNFKNIIMEEYNNVSAEKAEWMSKLAQIHSVYESKKGISVLNEGLQPNTQVANGIYTTPLNTMGMGNPMLPNGGMFGQPTEIHDPAYKIGSGDVPMSTLTASLEIAAVTVGFDLVPVVPAAGPVAFLSFNDFPYAGGKLGRLNETAFDGIGEGDENKPIYIKVSGDLAKLEELAKVYADQAEQYPEITLTTNHGVIKGLYLGNSRIDNNVIIKINSVKESADGKNISIASVFATGLTKAVVALGGKEVDLFKEGTVVRPELVKGVTDHVQGFTNFFNGSDDPMSRAENETGTGNTIGARIFTKMITMGSYEVTGSVTRQQLQDMPLYGVDVIGGVLEAMRNEVSQSINNRLLDRVFKLGVENYKIQRSYQGVDLNLFLADATQSSKALKNFAPFKKFVGLDGKTPNGEVAIANATKNTSAENVTTHQRRIASRCLAASNLIANTTRKGRANWMVCNTQILSALQDCSQFVISPMRNTLIQGGEESLYFAGELMGLQVYVDPYMKWDDTRICVGRKASISNNKVNGSGVVFMPYILADQVQIVAEGTMAPKMLMNSRFAIVDCGFYPEQNYYTFMVDTAEGMII
jgi:hypothetical protein